MTILGIDHIEFYVADAQTTAEEMCTRFGLRIAGLGGPETGDDTARTLLLTQADVRILVTSALSAAHPAAAFVASHGDGVAVVSFAVHDLASVYTAAVTGGARSVQAPEVHGSGDTEVRSAVVSGFGDVTHRLVERSTSHREFLPGRIEMIAADPDEGDALLTVIDHAAVCVPVGELDSTVDFYAAAFGFGDIFQEYISIGEQGMLSRVVQSPSGGVTFTLLQPDPARSRGQIDDFLDWHGGAGVQHVAFHTGDIRTAVRTFGARGVAFASTPASYYDVLEERLGRHSDLPVVELTELGVLVDHDHWGQMFQIFMQSTHPRRTLFLELIERHGAKTFGSSNIRALYEAKERELAAVRATSPDRPA
jgi:4-hydroxymandelate synthase